MIRSTKKGVFINYFLLKEMYCIKKNQKLIKTMSRSSIIIPDMLNRIIGVYNGQKYIPVKIISSIVGYKLGEFSPTRLFRSHKKTDKKLQRKKS